MNETTGLATASPSDIAAAVELLAGAAASGAPCAPVRGLIGRNDLAAAYAVQAALTASRLAAGARVVGRKVGLTSEAVQRQLGVDQPDLGVLFDDMAYVDGDTIPVGRVLQPRAEAEWAPVGAPPRIVPRFAVVPRRWVVDRTFAWLGRYRRLAKDYEYLPATSENTIYLAMAFTLLHRLARTPI